MKSLKAGQVPKRGNPNNSEDQQAFVDKKPAKGGYPDLGPQPDFGLPGSDEEERKSDESADSDDSGSRSGSGSGSGSDRSDSPPPKKKETYKPPPPKPAAKSKGSSKVKDKEFYKAIEQAKKHCKNGISNLGYSKVDSSIEELELALDILRDLQ